MKCFYPRTPKLKKTKHKKPEDEKNWPKFQFWISVKGHEQQIMKIDNSKTCKISVP